MKEGLNVQLWVGDQELRGLSLLILGIGLDAISYVYAHAFPETALGNNLL
jgi:hypothetical protein